jgi:hypothetical protein
MHRRLHRLATVELAPEYSVVQTDQVLRSLWLQDSAKFRAEIL